ncbi:MAG TPA: hypothetical protein VFK56_06125 [Mycobacterium sp.]|nr:hypothetical protein [Mycobacterium sp.]
MGQTVMSLVTIQHMRLCAAVIGGGAVLVLGGAAVYYTNGAQVTAAGTSSAATAVTTTPPTAPAIEKAVPSIVGPAPYAGEAPDSNPQAAIP